MNKKLILNRLWIALLFGLCVNVYQAFPVFAETPDPIVTVQSYARVGEQVPLRVDFYGHSVYLASSFGWVVYSKPDGCIINQFGALDCRSGTVSQKSLVFVIGFQSTGTHQLNVTNYAIEQGDSNNGIAKQIYLNPALTATPTLTPTPTSTPTATPTVTPTNVPTPVCYIDVLYGQNYAAVTYISNLDVIKSEIRTSSGQVVFTGNAANANTPTSLFHFNPTVGITYKVWTKTAHPMEWNACTPSYMREAATPTATSTPLISLTPGTPVPPATATPMPTSTATATIIEITPPASATPTVTPTATIIAQPTRMAIVAIVNSKLSIQAQMVPVHMVVEDQDSQTNNLEKDVDGISEQQYIYSPPANSNQTITVVIDPKNIYGMLEVKTFYVVDGIIQLTPPQGPRIFLPLINR